MARTIARGEGYAPGAIRDEHHEARSRTIEARWKWRSSRRRARPGVECLEDRRLLAVSISDLPIPMTGGDSQAITTGPDGNLWFTLRPDGIGTINSTTHQIDEYTTPTPGSFPGEIVAGPDGNLWFTESFVGKIAEINPRTREIAEFPLPTPFARPYGIALGPHKKIWFTESGLSTNTSQIGAIDPVTKQITEFATPTAVAGPIGITAGPDGKLWFTEAGLPNQPHRIGEIDPVTGVITEFPVGAPGDLAGPEAITTGSDGRLWFTEFNGKVGAFDPVTHAVTQVPLLVWPVNNPPGSATAPGEITNGPDGNLWITVPGQQGVTVLNPTTLEPAQISTPQHDPAGITVGSDHTLWFTSGSLAEGAASGGDGGPTGIGTIDPLTEATAFYPYTTTLAPQPDAITKGADGHVWFTDDTNRIGELDPATGIIHEYVMNSVANLSASGITLGPDGAIWFTVASPTGSEIVYRIDPATKQVTWFGVAMFPELATATSVPLGITAGPDGNIWFTMSDGAIGEIDLTTQGIRIYPVSNPDPAHSASRPFAITAGPDGNLWFTDQAPTGGAKIGMINPVTHSITEYPLPDLTATPWDITSGPDRNLWFTERDAHRIGIFNPTSHQISELPLPGAATPTGIAAGPDGKLWVCESVSTIASIDPTSHQITEYDMPTPYDTLQGITAGPDGKVYFAENFHGGIGVIDLSAGLAPAPSLASASDTGVSQTDGITRNNGSAAAPLVFAIPSADSDLEYRLYEVTNPDNPVLLAGPVMTSDGTVTVSGTALTDGMHRIAYTSATSTSGTESALSAPVSITIQTSLTITSTNPEDGAVVSALPDGSVTITFSHGLAGLSAGGTALLPSDPFDVMLIPRGPDQAFRATSTLNSSDFPVPAHTLYRTNPDGTSSITLTPTEPLSSDVFLIAVKLTDFTDLAGNPLTDDRGGYRTFLIQLPPISTDPLRVMNVTSHEGSAVINNNLTVQPDTIAVQFNKPLFAAAAGDNVQLIANPGPSFRIVPALAAYSPSTDSIDLTPEAPLNPGTVYAVAVYGTVSDDQGYGGPGHPLGQTFYDTFTVSNSPISGGSGPLRVAGAPGSPQIIPFPGTSWPNPVGYISIPFTERLDLSSLVTDSVMLIPRSGGTQSDQFDAADVPLNATVAFNPNTNQLIIVPSQPVGNDVYLLALGGLLAANGDPLLNDAGQPAGVSGNPPYYATFQVAVPPSAGAARAAVPSAMVGEPSAPIRLQPAATAVVPLTRAEARSAGASALPAGRLRVRPVQPALSRTAQRF